MRDNLYWQIFLVFAPLSLISLGGGQSVIADINNQVVHLHGWLTQQEFVDLFAISRAGPGPGSLLSTLIGWKISGVAGAAVASLAYFVPSSLIAYVAAVAWNRHHGHAWHAALERGLAPVATGLILSGAYTILEASTGTISVWIIAAVTGVIFTLLPNLNPLPVLLVAGLAQVAARMIS